MPRTPTGISPRNSETILPLSKAPRTESKPKHPAAAKCVRSGIFKDLKSFRDLEKKISKFPTTSEAGDAFEVFAEAFLATQKISGAKPGSIRPLDKVSAELAKTLRIPQKDYGIDGIYEDDLPGYKAYQVKFRSGRPSLTWDELSTFFGLSDSSAIHTKIVFTNCDSISEVVNQRPNFLAIRGNDLDRLTRDDFKEIEAWLQGSIVKHVRKSPRPHQEEAVRALFQSLLKEDRTTGIMACGTGKTLVALWTIEQWVEHLGKANAKDENQGKILVLLPSLALLRQTLHEWLRETSFDPLSYLAVCSDPTVGSPKDDHLEVKQSELDFEVTTEPESVRRWLNTKSIGPKIIFSTYQSARVVAEAMKPGDSWDIALFDEAHKTAGREGKSFAFALEDKNIPIKKRLFLTATPRHYNPIKKDKDGEETLVFSMDKPEVYGSQAYTLSFAKAASPTDGSEPIICRYKVLVSIVNTRMVNDFLLQKGESRVGGDDVRARQVANQISIQYAHEKYKVKKIFSFHKSIASAQDFTSDSSQGIKAHLPEFSCFHVSGEMSAAKRDKLIENFRDAGKAIMSNARCLTEGVDVPAVDMVAFLSPRRSHIDIVQATGRTMRRAPGKEVGYILLPLYVQMAEGEDVEVAVARTGFDEVWAVLGALQEQDEVLADILRDLAEDKGRGKGHDDQSRLREVIEFVTPFVFLGDLKRAIGVKCVDQLLLSWDVCYGKLHAFYKANGHCDVPRDGQRDLMLLNWIGNNRQFFKRGRLSQDRIDRLNALNFSWDPLYERWEENFQKLKKFHKANGHCNVSRQRDPELGKWVDVQRQFIKKGWLSKDRIDRLNELNFSWNPKQDFWEKKFRQLQAFHRQYGHCNVPRNHPELGIWVGTQRGNKHRLPQDKIDRLSALNFAWHTRKNLWEENFQRLRTFQKENGHCNVPAQTPILGGWVSAQRQQFRKNALSQERKYRLDSIGFSWGPDADAWEENFQLLYEYKQKYGHCDIQIRPKEAHYKTLGTWVGVQRTRFKNGRLPENQKQRLDEIGFTWDPFDSAWDAMYQQLCAYHRKYGDCVIRKSSGPSRALASWTRRQRERYQQNLLSTEQISRLNTLNFSWDPKDEAWEEMFQRLSEYRKQYGHCNVPKSAASPEHNALSTWVSHQRSRFKKGRLRDDRKTRLDTLGFSWTVPLYESWERFYSQLREYYKLHGHCNVTQKTAGLGTWVSDQRTLFKKGLLANDKQRLLEALHFSWYPIEDAWEQMFQQLREYKKRHGHCNIRWKSSGESKRLNTWANKQRDAYRSGKLDPDKKNRLTKLGFSWDPFSQAWDEMFRQLCEYHKKHGHCYVPQKYSTASGNLGTWVSFQRATYNKGRLSQERIDRLNAIGFSWNPPKGPRPFHLAA